MEKNKSTDDILDLQWQDDLQDLVRPKAAQTGSLFEYRYKDVFNEIDTQKLQQKQQQTFQGRNQKLSAFQQQQIQMYMKQVENQRKQSKSQHFDDSPSKSKKNIRGDKQKVYSKVYRQKMKQKYKCLQEQNEHLKKRIFQLQSQLRQQEIQLNRFKFPSPQKQLSIEELNRQFFDLSVDYIDSLRQQPGYYQKKWFLTQSSYHKFFIEFYAERGFAGKKKLKILNYHFNQFLQTVLKDTQKYLSLVYFNSEKYNKLVPIPELQLINKAYLEIYKPEGDLWHRLKTFNKFLKPMSLQLNKQISLFYKKYEDILGCCNQIHNFIKENYLNNMDIGRRRLQMQSWFDFHKQSKVMRQLRYKWFDWMKSLAQQQEQEEDKARRGSKRKKTGQQE